MHVSLSQRRRSRHTVVAGAIVALALILAAPLPVAAETTDPGDITWAVAPADESGPDGRGIIEQELDPGATTTDRFAVRNLSTQPVTFKLSAADGYYTPTGRFNMLASDQESVDAGTWIQLPESVSVEPNSTAVVEFTTTVPDGAEPGDHAAGIAASVLSVGTDEQGSQIGVESRIGFRVMTRVSGDLVPAATVSVVSSDYALSWNPLRPGSVDVTFSVVNEGNTRLLAGGAVRAGFESREFPGEGDQRQELLPGESREITTTVDGVWPLFVVPTSIVLDPTATSRDGETVAADETSAEVVVWAIPVPQLLWLAGIALVVGALLWGRSRSRKKTAQLVAEARERGRREAAASTSDPAAPAGEPVPAAHPHSSSADSDGVPSTRRSRQTLIEERQRPKTDSRAGENQ